MGLMDYVRAAAYCKLCKSKGRRTEMYVPGPGCAAVCPQCDRARCGNCKQPVLEPRGSRCTSCGLSLRPLPRPDR